MKAFNSGGSGPASDEESFQTKEDGMINNSFLALFPDKKCFRSYKNLRSSSIILQFLATSLRTRVGNS